MVTIAAVALVCVLAAVVVAALIREQRSRDRAFTRALQTMATERKELLDRIMYMAEKPWAPPPFEEEPAPPEEPLYFPEGELLEREL